MRRCPECRKRIAVEARKCPYCRTDLTSRLPGGGSQPLSVSRSSPFRHPFVIVVVLGLVLALAATSFLWLQSRSRRGEIRTMLTAARQQLSGLQERIEDAELAAEVARGEAALLRGEVGSITNLRLGLRRAKRNYALATRCIDDLIFAYNSASTLFEIPNNFGAALNAADCSSLGYYFE